MTRCGIVLAAGDGTRLQPFIQRWRGDALPKQYVNFLGLRSMLEQTWQRAELLIAPERLVTVVGQHHLSFHAVLGQLARRPAGTVVVQPQNRETGPGLLLPLVHLAARHPDAVAAIFPSDHYIAEETLFMGHVELAFRAVERDPDRVVILGIEPQAPESDYGYILPAPDETAPYGCIKRVARFVEKPRPDEAEELIRAGALWNSFVIVARPRRLLELVHQAAPALYDAFEWISLAIGTPHEAAIIDEIYRTLPAVNFSRAVLQRLQDYESSRLSVLPMRGVTWNDWGSEARVTADLQRLGHAGRVERPAAIMARA